MRRRGRLDPLPPEEALSDTDDAEAALAERLDGSHYRDDVLRLLFMCCHPDLPATQQIALALRIVSGLSVRADRPRLPGRRGGDGAADHARQGADRRGDVPFETPGAVERAERLGGRRGHDLPAVQRGLFRRRWISARADLCGEAIRLARLLLRLFQTEPEIMGLTALMLLQHARAAARFDAAGEIVLLEDQDRGRWDAKLIAEGLALIDKAMRHRQRRAVSDPGGHRRAACPRRAGRRTPTGRRSTCSMPRWSGCSRRRW